MEQQTATIVAERDDRKAEYEGFSAIEGIVVQPVGEFPTQAFHDATDLVDDMNIALKDGARKKVGEVVYDPTDASDSYEIREL